VEGDSFIVKNIRNLKLYTTGELFTFKDLIFNLVADP